MIFVIKQTFYSNINNDDHQKKMNILSFRQKPDNILRPLVRYSFVALKYLIVRINYQLWQYQQRQISLTYSSLIPAIIITTTGWICTIFWIAKTQWPNDVFPVTIDESARIFHIPCFMIVVRFMIVINCILEILWIIFIRKVLNYDSGINDLLIYYSIHDDDLDIFQQYKQYLYRLTLFSDYISMQSAISFILALTYWMARTNYELFLKYNAGEISLIILILSILLIIIEYIHCLFLISLIIIPFKALIIMVEFLIIQLKQVVSLTQTIFDYRFDRHLSVLITLSMKWHDFQTQYSHIFDHTSKLNKDLKEVLLAIETVSKASIIFATVFYSKRVTETMHGIYARLSNVPAFNHKCCRQLLAWNVCDE
ncbi:uncharacterized protein LOC142646360 [Dermatophagoides pteronyssinus]|uniref:uncharacterized protein LOC142646360 n=1 Tax=Dermatophagoides pteronyssinus TaxID=6956 RepID=UPI003F66BB70